MSQILLWIAFVSSVVIWPGLALSRSESESSFGRFLCRFGGLSLAVACLVVFAVEDYSR